MVSVLGNIFSVIYLPLNEYMILTVSIKYVLKALLIGNACLRKVKRFSIKTNVIVIKDITDNFLAERLRFNHLELLLQLLPKHISFATWDQDACQNHSTAHRIAANSLPPDHTRSSYTVYFTSVHFSPVLCYLQTILSLYITEE